MLNPFKKSDSTICDCSFAFKENILTLDSWSSTCIFVLLISKPTNSLVNQKEVIFKKVPLDLRFDLEKEHRKEGKL
ncbi:MAG: hypothetical protein DRP47_12750 [Candidatus Zixiibacteriota bacterium]|nr:MAG: hypothetical protein DRP47_12750 [candidate division Zixibacteria bacterium]